jgi:hypothetical protein
VFEKRLPDRQPFFFGSCAPPLRRRPTGRCEAPEKIRKKSETAIILSQRNQRQPSFSLRGKSEEIRDSHRSFPGRLPATRPRKSETAIIQKRNQRQPSFFPTRNQRQPSFKKKEIRDSQKSERKKSETAIILSERKSETAIILSREKSETAIILSRAGCRKLGLAGSRLRAIFGALDKDVEIEVFIKIRLEQ